MTTEKPNAEGARRRNSAVARERVTKLPPLPIGPYAVVCPQCSAQPGAWCEATLNLPPGTLLRDPHDARRIAANVQP